MKNAYLKKPCLTTQYGQFCFNRVKKGQVRVKFITPSGAEVKAKSRRSEKDKFEFVAGMKSALKAVLPLTGLGRHERGTVWKLFLKTYGYGKVVPKKHIPTATTVGAGIWGEITIKSIPPV